MVPLNSPPNMMLKFYFWKYIYIFLVNFFLFFYSVLPCFSSFFYLKGIIFLFYFSYSILFHILFFLLILLGFYSFFYIHDCNKILEWETSMPRKNHKIKHAKWGCFLLEKIYLEISVFFFSCQLLLLKILIGESIIGLVTKICCVKDIWRGIKVLCWNYDRAIYIVLGFYNGMTYI